MAKKVVLAYSGGLDTSVAIRWLKETHGLDVVTLTLDIGQPTAGLDDAVSRAKKIGAVQTIVVDARDEFIREFIWPAVKANALYEGIYPLATALGRPLIAKKLVEAAHSENADFVSHGCTAKGNDQVRIEVGVRSLDPAIKVIAPMREWVYTRAEAVDYAKKHGIVVPVKKESPYSIDENIYGRSVESGLLEDPNAEPREDAYAWTKSPTAAPDEPATVTIGFEHGVPVSLNGMPMSGIELIGKLNSIGGENGVGRIDHVENRLVGIKSREVYEAPAALILVKAHKDLETITITKDVAHFKSGLEQKFAELTYNGLWYSPLMKAIAAFVDETQKNVTGAVTLKLFKGSATVIGKESPHSLYDVKLATYGTGDAFDHTSAKGFIDVWGLPSRVAAAVDRKSHTSGPDPKKETLRVAEGQQGVRR
ncbi:MAG: argininosuccinate synthase [Euryarchaeota archaeon]|nr:argininosuccinate synthase [Euryarchaeota archaeon]